MQRNLLVNWLNQNPQSWVRTSGNINLPNNPLGKLDATKHNLTEIETPPLEKTPLPTQSATLPKSAMKRFFKSRLAYEEGSEAGAGTLAETPAQSRFLWFRPNDGENLLKIGTEDTLKELAEVWKKQRREQDKANAEAKRLEQEKKEKSLRSSQFGAVMEIAKQNNGDLSWMDNVNTKIANEYFPDLYKNKEDFQNLKHNLQLLLVGDIEYGEFLAGYAENKPWYIDDGYTKEEKQWLKQGGWRAQTQQQKPLSWGAWDVVDTINLPGKWMEMIDDRAQKIPTAKSFFNIEEREKTLQERINALSEEERWKLEDKFKDSPAIQKLYGNVDNYIKATQRSFVDELLDIGYENVWPNLWKMLANAPWSAIKTATAIWRGLTNPADTIAGLGQAVFTEEGRNALKERYIDNLAQTIEEDPVGLASDALTVAELGAKGLASGLKVSGLTKNAKIWALSQKVANFGKTAGEVADLGLGRVYGKGIDALTNIQHNNSSNILKAGAVALRATQEPLKVIGEWLHAGVDKLIGLDKRTKQALENNPFVWKYFERTKQYIEENGLSPESKKEINTEHIKGLSSEILDLINSKKDTLRDTGELYEKIKNANVEFDNQGVKEKLNTYLEDHGIKIKDWKLDFSDSVIVKEWDMRAIEKVYDWATRESYEAKVGLNQRKKMDKIAYPDGAPSAGTEIIKGMRRIFDENMKEKVPGLKEADNLYSEKIKELEQIEDGLIYKQGDRKGQLRDNFEQIVNTLDWPNRARMLQRLDELRPGLWDEIRAVHMMGKLTDMYFKTPTKLSDYFTNAIGLVWGWLLGSRYGIGGMIAGAIGGWLVKQGATKLSQRAIRKAIDNVTPSSLARLKEIEAKIQAGKGMSPEERILIDQIGEKILQESELLNKTRNKEQALPAPEKTAVWEERPKWGNILGDTIARNANPVSKRGEKYQVAMDTISWFNKKKFLNSFQTDSDNPVHINAMKEMFKDEYEKLSKEYVRRYDFKSYKTAIWIAKKRKEQWVYLMDNHYKEIKNPTLDDYKNEAIKEREKFVLSRIKELYWRYLEDNGKGEIIQANKNLLNEYPTIEKEVLAKEGIWIDEYYDIKSDKRRFKRLLGEYHKSIKNRIETLDPIAEWKIKTEITDKNQWMLTALYKAWESNNATIKWYASSEWFDANHEYYDMKNKYVKEALDEWVKNKINDIEPLTFGDVLYFNFKDWRQMSFHRFGDNNLEDIWGEWYLYKWRMIKREGGLFIWNEQIVNPLTLELEDYKKLYLENKEGIRYQKYWIADNTEKTLSAQQAKELKNFRNGKSVEEIAKDYGVEINIVDKITTPEGARAYGKYGDWIITLAEKIKEGTAPHELFHAAFDLVDSTKKESILEGVMKEKKLDKLEAEEYLADSFSEYFRTGRMKWEKVVGNVWKPLWKKLYDAVKDFFKQVKDWITGVSKNKKQVKQLFDDILDGEVEKWNIYLKTPDGKVYQQAGNIYSNNFKKWFGDWEKDSKNASKIVNEEGEPLVMYHGTDADFSIFDKKLIKSSNYGDGFYFTSDIRNAKNYGSKTKAVYLDVKNPLDLTTSANDAEFNKRYGKNNSPYDGYIVRFRNGEKMVVVKDSTQIKSATDNVWTFDSNNPDTRYQLDGKVKEIWEWEFGKIYEWVKWADAEQFLIQQKWGEVRWAYSYKNEPVDLIRGEFDGKKGYWLKKIAEKHPEVIGKIQDLLDTLPLMELRGERIILWNNTSKVVLSLNRKGEEKRWIVTAFDLKK